MKKHSLKLLAFSFVLALCFSFSFSDQSRADACLPTCAINDGRFLTFGGQNAATFVFDLLTFGVGSPAGAGNLHIRIFDGETSGLWDSGNINNLSPLEYTLFADPLGDTTGTIALGTWSGDGSSGLNIGNPMPDNDFFDIIIPNAPEAMAESGNFLYRMAVRNVDTNTQSIHNFKIQVVGPNTSLFIFPGDQPFGYEASWRGVPEMGTNTNAAEASAIVYPNFVPPGSDTCIGFFDDLCLDDPQCCWYSNYLGDFNFYFLNEDEGRQFIDFWDGDLDFGNKFPGEGPPFQDTDDPNTPPDIPIFADVPNTDPEGSYGGDPRDDRNPPGSNDAQTRIPNITYELIDPNSVSYLNDNPSATNEWELFQLNTQPGCAPNICDIEVEEIPQGIWNIRVTGMDMWNINYIRAFDKMVGVDENGEPVLPLDPIIPLPPPPVIPTMSEWGMIAVAFVLGAIGFYSLRKKRSTDSSSC